MARSRCVRSAAVSASTSAGSRICGSVRGHPDQRDTLAGPLPLPPGRQAPRHRVHAHIPAGQQEPVKPGHARQPPPQRPGRHPASLRPGHLQAAVPAGALRGHERQHIGRPDPPRRLAHHGEEDLQVIGHGQHRVRPAPASQELQVLIQQPDTQPHHQLPGRVPRPGSGGQQSQACRPSISIRTGLSACQDPYEDHPHIRSRMVHELWVRCGSGAGGHVGGEDVVGVTVEVLAGTVVAHRGARVGMAAAIWTSRRSTPASSMVVTNVWRSMCGCVRAIWTPAVPARRRRRRVAACRSIRVPRLLSRIGPACGRRRHGRWPGRPLGAAGLGRPCCLCRRPAGPGARVPRQGRRCPRRWTRRSAAPAARAWRPGRSRSGWRTGGRQ